MGWHDKVDADSFPKQGRYVGQRAVVVFHYDTTRQLGATIVRDDAEDPGLLILRLDDGRHVPATECQWRPDDEAPRPALARDDSPAGEFGGA